MTKQERLSVAEQIDRMMQRVALGVLLVSIAYGMSAVRFFANETSAEILDISSQVLGVIIIILILPMFIKFVNMRRKNRQACKEPEGFVVEMFDKATGKAFQFTFIFLIALEFVNGAYPEALPGEFIIKLIMTVTLAIFSLTFFFLNRDSEESENDDGFGDGQKL